VFNNSLKQSIAIVTILLMSCATPYYGYSKAEWQKLSEEEKKTIQTEYDAIIQFNYRQEHEDQFDDRKQLVIKRGVVYE
jgi:TRAP-type C4-dicarboxylate transport system substrate-binding protein